VSDKAFEDGMAVRREMWGAELAEKALEGASAFARPFQEIMTRYCFGETWARPGLSRRDRSLITLAMLISQGRELEIRMHVQGALSNGVTPEEIREIVLQAMIYCGVPAAYTGLRAAEETLTRLSVEVKP